MDGGVADTTRTAAHAVQHNAAPNRAPITTRPAQKKSGPSYSHTRVRINPRPELTGCIFLSQTFSLCDAGSQQVEVCV